MRRATLEIEDRAFYVGPQPGDNHYGERGYYARPVGSSGKIRGRERAAVYVDWGGGNEGWEPRSYLRSFYEFLDEAGVGRDEGDVLSKAIPFWQKRARER